MQCAILLATSLWLGSGELALDYLLPTSWTPAVATQQIKLEYLTEATASDFCNCPNGCVCPDKSNCVCVPASAEPAKKEDPVRYEWKQVHSGYSYQRVCGRGGCSMQRVPVYSWRKVQVK